MFECLFANGQSLKGNVNNITLSITADSFVVIFSIYDTATNLQRESGFAQPSAHNQRMHLCLY